MTFRFFATFTILLSVVVWTSCKKGSHDEASSKKDPARCDIIDLGEAADLVENSSIKDDKMVFVHGIAHPHSLVWRDQRTGNVYYITRVMGTEQKLFFLKRVPDGEKPRVLSEFRGHLLRWNKLPLERSAPIAAALASQYNIHIKSESTYVIDGNGKPEGCP
ncbi:MAG: hypothetical protein GY847_31090 [Proteobacteria bacterium]|nr:hypothetical protein [Pseudomonadota bacterium]